MELLDQFIDQVLANRKLFLLHLPQSERHGAKSVEHEHNVADHRTWRSSCSSYSPTRAMPLTLRVRLACSVGAVLGALMGAERRLRRRAPGGARGVGPGAVRDLLDRRQGPVVNGSTEAARDVIHASS